MADLFKPRGMFGMFKLLSLASLFIIVILARWIGNRTPVRYAKTLSQDDDTTTVNPAGRPFIEQIKSVVSPVVQAVMGFASGQVKSGPVDVSLNQTLDVVLSQGELLLTSVTVKESVSGEIHAARNTASAVLSTPNEHLLPVRLLFRP